MAHFDDQRIVAENTNDLLQALQVLTGVVKRKRELQQYRTQAFNGMEHIEAHADELFVRGCCALFVGEFLPKLRGEKKSPGSRDAPDPLSSQFRTEWIIDRRVDLDGVEECSEISGLMKSARPPMGIND